MSKMPKRSARTSKRLVVSGRTQQNAFQKEWDTRFPDSEVVLWPKVELEKEDANGKKR